MQLVTTLLAMLVAAAATSTLAELTVVQKPNATTSCTLFGTYASGTSIQNCSTLIISSLAVPAGVTLDLSKAKTGCNITFKGTTTFGTKLWDGPFVFLSGINLKVSGNGVLDGQGEWYWKQGTSIVRPLFFRMKNVVSSTVKGLTLRNSPTRTFSINGSNGTTLSGLTLDSSAGDGLAKNTDGFDVGRNNNLTITRCFVHNQDDCLAMQSSTNTVFSHNTCKGGHGISIGSLGGPNVSSSNTVSGLVVKYNTIIDSGNGIRIKTIVGLDGLVENVAYRNNTLSGVNTAITIRSDYNKTRGDYTGKPTSLATIKGVTIHGLSGTATNMYSVLVNSSTAYDWSFSHITVAVSNPGSCEGHPSNITCV